MPRFQVYMDDDYYEKIKKMAKENNASISQTAGKLIINSIDHSKKFDAIFEAKKTNALLAYILGAVYDEDIISTNDDNVNRILDDVESGVKELLGKN